MALSLVVSNKPDGETWYYVAKEMKRIYGIDRSASSCRVRFFRRTDLFQKFGIKTEKKKERDWFKIVEELVGRYDVTVSFPNRTQDNSVASLILRNKYGVVIKKFDSEVISDKDMSVLYFDVRNRLSEQLFMSAFSKML